MLDSTHPQNSQAVQDILDAALAAVESPDSAAFAGSVGWATIDDSPFAEGFESFSRTLAGAKLENLWSIFQNFAREAADDYVRKGLDKIAAVDALHDMAVAYGLVSSHGPDAVQDVLAAAFEKIEHPPDDSQDDWPLAGEDDKAHETAQPLPFIAMSAWDESPVPPRDWAVPDRIPMRQPTLLSGQGAAGKSLLMKQLLVATALGREWLDMEPITGPTIYFGCEDDPDELHRRLDGILRYYNVAFRHLEIRGFKLLSYAGKDAVLGAPTRSGRIEPTNLFHQFYREACTIRPRIIALDTVSDVFAGNENDRSEVRQFMSLMRKLAMDANTAVLLAWHPSQSGISSGSGTSGSTQWHNSVRARMYLKSPSDEKKNGDDEPDNGLRELEFKKNQYGPVGRRITLRWKNGLFLPVSSGSITLEEALANDKVDDLFLTLLRRFACEGRNVTDKKGTTYAPAIFAAEPDAKRAKMSNDALADAMRRLFAAGQIRVHTEGPASKRRTKIIEVAPPSTNPPTNLPPPFHQPPEGGTTPPSLIPSLLVEGREGVGGSQPRPSTNKAEGDTDEQGEGSE